MVAAWGYGARGLLSQPAANKKTVKTPLYSRIAASQQRSPPVSQAQPDAAVKTAQVFDIPPVRLPVKAVAEYQTVANAVSKPQLASLLIQCPDQKGVVAALAQLLYGFGCNILESDQYTDQTTGTYFQRIRFDYSECLVGPTNTQVLEHAVGELAKRYEMEWQIYYDNKVKRVAILVSKLDHCLYDLLIRLKAGELSCQVPVIISNHPDLAPIAQQFGVAFRHLPLPRTDAESKLQQEAAIEQLLQELDIDLLVLARYMQIFSQDFCARHADHTINIHHSFLPAFEGARPYHKAHKRGVKIIGATAHFATAELDAGPIIEQDVTRITHRDSVKDMLRKGRDLERLVLARAVRLMVQTICCFKVHILSCAV
ncbi:hypothetical protein WJX77_011056 [Trebouxia sp. C0004]